MDHATDRFGGNLAAVPQLVHKEDAMKMKKAYQAPTLRRFGSVEQITLGTKKSNSDGTGGTHSVS